MKETIPLFKRKLTHLRLRVGVTQATVAQAIGVSAAAMSGYVSGVTDNDAKRPNELPSDRFAKLVIFLIKTFPHLDEERARAAWGATTLEEFEAACTGHPVDAIDGCLRPDLNTLHVRAEVTTPVGFGLVSDEAFTDDSRDGAILVQAGRQGMRFLIDTSPGRQLLAVCGTELGWQLLVPGRLHRGVARARCERLPEGRELTFKAPFGRHRFVFLEVETDMKLVLPHATGRLMAPSETQALARFLERGLASGLWRWGEVLVFVEETRA
jgi:transcriptional regulator with XRE-family HTH domain